MSLAVQSAFVAIAILAAFVLPQTAQRAFAALETRLCALADRPAAAFAFVILFAVVMRLAVVALIGWQVPMISDEFSLMLKVDTFLEGRLANPVHPLRAHFETVYVHQTPSYGSMYLPGRAFAPLIGALLAGETGLGVMLVMTALCASMLWALRGWTTPALGMLGALLFTIAFALTGYWAHGLGGVELGALGGTLVLGAYPRLMRKARWRDGLLVGLGASLLLVGRPFEGLFFCLPFALMLSLRLVSLLLASAWRDATRLAGAPVLLVLAGGGLLLADNAANTGDARMTAYELNRLQHAKAPAFILSDYNVPINADIPAHAAEAYQFELGEDLDRSLMRQLRKFAVKVRRSFLDYFGPILLIPFLFGLPAMLRRPVAFASGVTIWVAMALNFFTWSYYLAPAIGVIMLTIALGFGRLHALAWRSRPVGRALARLLVLLLVAQTSVMLAKISAREPPPSRAQAEAWLDRKPGKDLVIVRPAPEDSGLVQWVYNAADIDRAPIVWANDLGARENRRLLGYYPDRKIWLLDRLHPSGLRQANLGDHGEISRSR